MRTADDFSDLAGTVVEWYLHFPEQRGGKVLEKNWEWKEQCSVKITDNEDVFEDAIVVNTFQNQPDAFLAEMKGGLAEKLEHMYWKVRWAPPKSILLPPSVTSKLNKTLQNKYAVLRAGLSPKSEIFLPTERYVFDYEPRRMVRMAASREAKTRMTTSSRVLSEHYYSTPFSIVPVDDAKRQREQMEEGAAHVSIKEVPHVVFSLRRLVLAHSTLHRKMMELHSYCHQGCLEAVKKFVEEYGNGILEGQSRKGFRALHVAAMSLQYDVCEYLILERKVEVNCVTRRGETPLILVLKNWTNLNRRSRNQGGIGAARTLSCFHLNPLLEELLRLLLDNGGDQWLNKATLRASHYMQRSMKQHRLRPLSPLAVAMRAKDNPRDPSVLFLLLSYLVEHQGKERSSLPSPLRFIDDFEEPHEKQNRKTIFDLKGSRPRTMFEVPRHHAAVLPTMCALGELGTGWESCAPYAPGAQYDHTSRVAIEARDRYEQIAKENNSGRFQGLWHWLLCEGPVFHSGLDSYGSYGKSNFEIDVCDWFLALPGCGTEELLSAARDLSTRKLCKFSMGYRSSTHVVCRLPDALHLVPISKAFGNVCCTEAESAWRGHDAPFEEEATRDAEQSKRQGHVGGRAEDRFSFHFEIRNDLLPLLGEEMIVDTSRSEEVKLLLQRPGVFECVQV